ncbi:MAG: hypothetical protein UFX20_01035 [Longibaculum muris]|uniref:hypothetical protein n=1 Tax=Longibaculum muris TaxID=1796628 RepID=UPI00082F094A|nr:hypothetical protein [Longibaculum muris]MBS5371271.1 hypothetical protein [Coprobacillus cateniformis]MCR1888135.1 hypothetical protein [Longibaculum muris]MED9810662.1 hypothetical protein [Longibaculum muris]
MNRELNLLILDVSIYRIEVAEIAKSLRMFNKIDYLDDDSSKEKQVLGKWSDYRKYLDEYSVAIVAVGREEITNVGQKIQRTDFIVLTLIHPSADISEEVPVEGGEFSNLCQINNCGRVSNGKGMHSFKLHASTNKN